jgi:ABC-type lipoprotein release transport system permease subunit
LHLAADNAHLTRQSHHHPGKSSGISAERQVQDPFSIGPSVAILIARALFAGYLPAFRASRIDPMAALRNERLSAE